MSKVEVIVRGEDANAVRFTTQLIAETLLGENGVVISEDGDETSIDDFHENTPKINGFVASEAEFPDGIHYVVREQIGFTNKEVIHE